MQSFLYAHTPLFRRTFMGQHNPSLEDAELSQRMLIFCISCRPESVWWTLYH